jgi:hypothetical protein
MTARVVPVHDSAAAERVEDAYLRTVTEPDDLGVWLDGTLDIGDSGVGIWASADAVLPITPTLGAGSYRVAFRTRAQPQIDEPDGDEPGRIPRVAALDLVLVIPEGDHHPVRWIPAELSGHATAPVWKHFALVDPESLAMSKERRSSQWLEVMGSPPADDAEGIIMPAAGGVPAALRPMSAASEATLVPRLRVFEFRAATAMPGDVITGADLLGWVGVDGDGAPVALALDIGEGVRRRAAAFADVADAWAEPVGDPVGRPRLGPRVDWRSSFADHFLRPAAGGRSIGMWGTPVRIGSLRFPSGRIALTAASLREPVHVLDLKVPSDRDLPCFASGELHREPSILIRVADGRPTAWHLAAGRDGHTGVGTNGTVVVITDAELALQVVRGKRRPEGNPLLRLRLHTPDIHSILRADGDALAMNVTVPTVLPLVGVDDESRIVAVSFLAADHPHMVSGPREVVEALDFNVMSRGFSISMFTSEGGYAASVQMPVPSHNFVEAEDDNVEFEGTDRDGRPINGRPSGWDQRRFEVLHDQREPKDLIAIARVVAMASETRTTIRVERSGDDWRWSVVARGGIEDLKVAAAGFTGVQDGSLASEAFRFHESEDGWWVLELFERSTSDADPEQAAVIEPERTIDAEQAALVLREMFVR